MQIVQGNVALFVVHSYKRGGVQSAICLMLSIVFTFAFYCIYSTSRLVIF